LINAIADLAKQAFAFLPYDGLSLLPHFNPDQIDDAGADVYDFRELVRQSDAILICTPEYAHGVPGSLKNAIDWTVGTRDFSGKIVILITASSDGKFGHASLLETLRVIEAIVPSDIQILIPFAKTKINQKGQITDPQTLAELKVSLNRLENMLTEGNEKNSNLPLQDFLH
jgi:NAD(P)H-dependent FMN reductase